jgi:succinate-acetate transporter protein
MADESNVHVKVAMADVLGLLVISMFTAAVGIFGLGSDSLKLVVAIGPFVGIATLIAAVFAYLNENVLATAIFGPLAVFFFTIVVVGGLDAAVLCMFIGIIILADALVAFYQPVKLLPILLIIAAIAFFVTALWYNGSDLKSAVGGLWILYSIISWYMAAAIIMLVLKGKQVLPLLIKA